MRVKELIQFLQERNPEHDVVISGCELGLGSDLLLVDAYQYDDATYVTLRTGDSFEEGDDDEDK